MGDLDKRQKANLSDYGAVAYDCETDREYVYRNRHTGEEFHIAKHVEDMSVKERLYYEAGIEAALSKNM